jgi:hypothetical protein
VTRVLHSEGNYEEKKHFYKILHIMLYDKKVHPCYINMILMANSEALISRLAIHYINATIEFTLNRSYDSTKKITYN